MDSNVECVEIAQDKNLEPFSESSPHLITPQLSKRQQKKLAKREKWLQQKPERRAKEREKRKLKIKEAKSLGHDLGPSRKLLKALKMTYSTCKLKIVFDLSFDITMTEAEMSKTFKQLHRCYSVNRRQEAPLQLYLSGYSEVTKKQMSKLDGCLNWDVNFDEKHYSEAFDSSDILYLTSDSPNVLQDLDHSKAYIIGAMVDHNRLKGVCFEQAMERDIAHARLPIDTFCTLKTRTVLTIDQVYLIILRVTQGKTWQEAILETVPKRKGIEPRDANAVSELETVSENMNVPNNLEIIKCNEIKVENINCNEIKVEIM